MLPETYQALKNHFGESTATALLYDERPEQRFAGLDQNLLLQVMRGDDGKLLRSEFPSLRPWCSIMTEVNNTLTVDAAGNVTTCCYDSDHKNRLANIYNDGIREAWRRYKEILLGDLYDMPACAYHCIGGQRHYMPSVVCADRDARLEKWRATGDTDFPKRVSIEPAALCNYACEGCPANWNAKVMADLDAMYRGLVEGLPSFEFLGLGLYGEPTLNKALPDFVLRCRAVAPHLMIQLLTNGTGLAEAAARKVVEADINIITLAIHAGPFTENMLKYSKRGANYELVLRNLKRLVDFRNQRENSRTTIEVRTVLFNWNDSDELMDRLRLDVEAAGIVNDRPAAGRSPDRLYWVLDAAAKPERMSQRFLPGSTELAKLRATGYFNEF